ncbi:MAG: methyltransferase domain-containing protein [Deltaproteobacteria bacterium]|nr:methyltransferase domain-containing protein [Deltaproteobacteria bacterium]
MNEEEGKPKADLNWDDEGILPAVLSPDTEFVFRRMTEETLKAAAAANSSRVLDVGCGRAIDAAALAKKGGLLFGCEPSRIMLRKAREGLRKSGETVRLVGSLAETLPFAGQSFHRVVCKGAIDHFFSPERAVGEMGRVACTEGKVVISVANFESLSCFLSRNLNRFVRRIWKRDLPSPHIWEIPKDHIHKFDYPSTLGLAGKYLRVESIRGVSLFWGFPRWSNFLRRLPRPMALILLRSLDKIANWHPDWSDVLILVGRPYNHLPGKERSF